MGTTLTIAASTTGFTVPDMAISWLAAAIRYSEDSTTNRGRTGGLFQWEMFRQNAYELMAQVDASKFDREKGNALWIPKHRTEVLIDVIRRDNALDEETYGS